MKNSQVYMKGFHLHVAIVFLLAFIAPVTAGQASATGTKQDRARQSKGGRTQQKRPPASDDSKSSTTKPIGSVNKNAPIPPPTRSDRNTESAGQKDDDEQQIKTVEDANASQETDGVLSWLTAPVLGLVALLIIVALALHLFHFLKLSSLNGFVVRLAAAQSALAHAAKGDRVPAPNTAVEKVVAELDKHDQVLSQLSDRLSQVDCRLTISDSQFRDAVHAVTLTANWIGQSQLKDAFATNGGRISDSERGSAIAILERYREPLRLNANRVEAVTQRLAELLEAIEGRAYLSPELSSRVQSLYQEIRRFDQWYREVTDELNSLRLGSFAERTSLLQEDQDRLIDQVNNGSLSIAQMVQKSRILVEKYFPEPAQRIVKEVPALADRDVNLKKTLDGAGDYVMDWYNNLFQLQHQLEQGQRSGAEAEIATELVKIQQIAREALSKFDIQPEAIQIGQTSYDRRLHEAILVRPSQFPINTVIEIHQCGFRKMSTGEALRRPQVIVAGAAVG